VITAIRDEYQKACGEIPDDETAVAEVADGQAGVRDKKENDDPMEELEDIVDRAAAAKPKAKAKPKKYSQGAKRAEVQELKMPIHPTCSQSTKTIYVYRKPSQRARNNTSLYLRSDCLEWLLSYAADERHFYGVERNEEAQLDDETGNCPAVADLRLTWDFTGKAWDAEFVAGAFVGVKKTRRCAWPHARTLGASEAQFWRLLVQPSQQP